MPEIVGTVKRYKGMHRQQCPSMGRLIAESLDPDNPKWYWPDTIIIIADFKSAPIEKLNYQYRWKSTRYPEAIRTVQSGDRVAMTCTLTPYTNGLGAYITRARNIVVTPKEE